MLAGPSDSGKEQCCLVGLLILVPFLNTLFLVFLAFTPKNRFKKQQVTSVG